MLRNGVLSEWFLVSHICAFFSFRMVGAGCFLRRFSLRVDSWTCSRCFRLFSVEVYVLVLLGLLVLARVACCLLALFSLVVARPLFNFICSCLFCACSRFLCPVSLMCFRANLKVPRLLRYVQSWCIARALSGLAPTPCRYFEWAFLSYSTLYWQSFLQTNSTGVQFFYSEFIKYFRDIQWLPNRHCFRSFVTCYTFCAQVLCFEKVAIRSFIHFFLFVLAIHYIGRDNADFIVISVAPPVINTMYDPCGFQWSQIYHLRTNSRDPAPCSASFVSNNPGDMWSDGVSGIYDLQWSQQYDLCGHTSDPTLYMTYVVSKDHSYFISGVTTIVRLYSGHL